MSPSLEEIRPQLAEDIAESQNWDDVIVVGDMVTYSGSLTQYHGIEFSVIELFDFMDVPCAMLQGPRLDIWIKRCRVSNLQLVEEEE